MIGSSGKEKYILLIILTSIVIIAIMSNENQEKNEDILIPDEILDCDYCTFNYRTPFTLAYTYLRPDGNRIVEGQLDILNAKKIAIQLNGEPEWVVAAPSNNGSIWAVVMDDGTVDAFKFSDGKIDNINISPSQIHPDSPPILMIKDEKAFLLAPGLWNESLFTHPIILTSSGRNVFIDSAGDLVFRVNEKESSRLNVDALPDARLLIDENERIMLLTGPTEEYDHGVLGDSIEASSITIVDTIGNPSVSTVINVPEGNVIEGIAPIWTDIDEDGIREIVVTLSNIEEGARLVVFDENGNILAKGPAAGSGYRWRQQIAVAPFGPGGQTKIADVLTPHIGGVVEFYQWEGNELISTSSLYGYSSHLAGSGNLDMAVAGNFDEDENTELLVPSQDYEELAILKEKREGIQVVGKLKPGGRINTNIAAVNYDYTKFAIGAGTSNDMLTIWY
jgi:hypothetical protein